MKDMTYKEAKNLIDDITWKYNGNSITNEMICKCRDKCREALEKQIPKKIIRKSKKASLEDIKCPNCQREIDAMNIVNYCTYCGQALDWSAIE